MKINNLILLVSLLIMGSQVVSSQSKTGDLPVFDFSKNYPQKKLRLQDMAEIEYVPLETTDEFCWVVHRYFQLLPINIFLSMNPDWVIYLFSIVKQESSIHISITKDRAGGNIHGLMSVQF